MEGFTPQQFPTVTQEAHREKLWTTALNVCDFATNGVRYEIIASLKVYRRGRETIFTL